MKALTPMAIPRCASNDNPDWEVAVVGTDVVLEGVVEVVDKIEFSGVVNVEDMELDHELGVVAVVELGDVKLGNALVAVSVAGLDDV